MMQLQMNHRNLLWFFLAACIVTPDLNRDDELDRDDSTIGQDEP